MDTKKHLFDAEYCEVDFELNNSKRADFKKRLEDRLFEYMRATKMTLCTEENIQEMEEIVKDELGDDFPEYDITISV